LSLSNGTVIIGNEADGSEDLYYSAFSCAKCVLGFDVISPQLFSFNSPLGMCKDCDGLGTLYTFLPEKIVPDPKLSLYKGAIPQIGPLQGMGRWRKHIYTGVADYLEFDVKTEWNKLQPIQKERFLYGCGKEVIEWQWKQRGGGIWKHSGVWEGIIPQLLEQFKKLNAGARRQNLEKLMTIAPCRACEGERLNPQARAVRIQSKSLIELNRMSIEQLFSWIKDVQVQLSTIERQIGQELLTEIESRLQFLLNVGLDYITLERTAPTLSGGELQRIRLASQIGSGLIGVLYVLDEPSIGLHPRDNQRLLKSLMQLRDQGNTLLVVEHDEETIAMADHVVDFGPGAGHRGGSIIGEGSLKQLIQNPESHTGQYFQSREKNANSPTRRTPSEKKWPLKKVSLNNLQNVSVDIPLERFVTVVGVSGSGKSTLVNDILIPEVRKQLVGDSFEVKKTARRVPQPMLIERLIEIDQSPIGRTPRSNPATYTKLFDDIRDLFAAQTESKLRGYTASRFTFNRPGGRCEHCEGNGATLLEMDLLPDVWVPCPLCQGKRFNHETLQVTYRGLHIAQVLQLEVKDACKHFEHVPDIARMLNSLLAVGLDYIQLGQSSTTLSGGEAQRIKLAKELGKPSSVKTLYVLDEPTTGLHFADVAKLVEMLQDLVARGHSVLVIEHHLDVIFQSDWLIELGPEGGLRGGKIVAEGTPEELMKQTSSVTGQELRRWRSPEFYKQLRKSTPKKSLKQRGTPRHIEVRGAAEHNLKDIDLD
ncbi:MAG: excinuclease ABC subunit UvrA, partial [Gemmataceae bacterium]